MKIVTQQILGGPDVLHTAEAPRPEPGPGEVLIALGATSLNSVDRKLRDGTVTHFGAPPFTLGFDISGRVVASGDDAVHPVGSEVFGMAHTATGTYSEFVAAPARALALRPPGLDDLRAAALPTAGLTAWQALDLAAVREGEHVLIHGGSGGVGHLAVQLAVLRGARVTATARTTNSDFLRHLGAGQVIDYTAIAFDEILSEVDVVLDFVGGDYGRRSVSVLAADGRYIGAQAANTPDDPRVRSVTGRPSASMLRRLGELVVEGSVRVHIDRVLPLSDAAQAHAFAENTQLRGKLVLTPWT
ncbi:NADP-dependent oxidoreductase [Nocardia sp. NPDC051750]|uniref:NADP-dependent oxidoreductase n=1 Tax=Nocardia sp. NPDC051750 TaxID=3364325 RepID=UPI0037B16119